jgi:aminopeptidase
MNKMEIMTSSARSAMEHILDLVPGDRVLVVTDKETESCGRAYGAGAAGLGCKVDNYILPEEQRPLLKMPDEMLTLLDGHTVVINALSGNSDEIPFRIQWLNAVEATGRVRMGHSPGIDEDMMVNGPLNIDYALLRTRAEKLITAFTDAVSVRITSDAGTDLHVDISGRPFLSDVHATEGAAVNLPCGEIYCAPVETAANGMLIVDGCFGDHGVVSTPVAITVKGGQAIDVSGENQHEVDLINRLMDTDENARTIAELGIGINPGARLTPRMLESEKAFRTAHIAFGSNEGMPGGCSISAMHMDYLFHAPNMTAAWPDGKTRVILEDGDFNL